MEEKKEIKRPRIETDCFVAAWVKAANEGGTQADVAEALGCSVAGALSKWKRLRDDGAILPELPAGSRKAKVDIDEINAYINANLKRKKVAS
jgi:transposase-like protein